MARRAKAGFSTPDTSLQMNGLSKYGAFENDATETGTPVGCYKYWTLPSLRYANAVKLLLVCDMIASLALWICGGTGNYLLDSIMRYNFATSSFDIAVMASAKCLCLVFLYDATEKAVLDITVTFRSANQPHAVTKRNALLALTAGVSGLSLAFIVVKGAVVLNDSVYAGERRVLLPETYYALTAASAVLSLVEFFLACALAPALRSLKATAVEHFVNEWGAEVDKTGLPLAKEESKIKQLLSVAKPEAGLLVFAMLALTLSSVCTIFLPMYFGKVVDAAMNSQDNFDSVVITMFLIQAGQSITTLGRAWLFGLCAQRIVSRIRKQLLLNIINQEIGFFDVMKTGVLTSRLSSDTQLIETALTSSIQNLLRHVFIILGSIVVTLDLNPSLAGMLMAVVPLVSIGGNKFGTYVKKVRSSYQQTLSEAGTIAEETISNIRTVRSLSAECKVASAYGMNIDQTISAGEKLSLADGAFQCLITFVTSGSSALVMWYGGTLVHKGQMSAGVLAGFAAYTSVISSSFGVLLPSIGEVYQAVGASVAALDLMRRKPLISVAGGSVPSSFISSVEFKNVTFGYPTRKESAVLQGVSLCTSPGQVLALVGPSGGGKSTVLSLIERFYEPDDGVILIGQHPLQELDLSWLRRKIALVSQEPSLLACSIRDNIAYGCQEDVSDYQIIQAAKQANAHDFIVDFPKGYETIVGERGMQLSGGQKQRIAIARALIINPSIMLLDEATSALDAESEHLVQEAIDRAMVGRTVIVVAHRLSTVRNASQVAVISNGKVVESGTHDELLKKDGVYKQLVIRQLATPDSAELQSSAAAAPQCSQ